MIQQPYYFSHLLLRQVPIHDATKNMLDVGCGSGWLTRELKHQHPSLKIDGMDKHYKYIQASTYAAHQQQLDISYRIENIESLSAETYKEHYDLITCHNVLGHVWKAEVEILKLLSWVKKGGVLSLIIENSASRWLASSMRESSISFEELVVGYEQNELPEAFVKSRPHQKTRRVVTGDQRVLYSYDEVAGWLHSMNNVSFQIKGLSVFMDYLSDSNVHSSEQLTLEQKMSTHPLWNRYAYFYHFLITKKE